MILQLNILLKTVKLTISCKCFKMKNLDSFLPPPPPKVTEMRFFPLILLISTRSYYVSLPIAIWSQ